MPADPQVEQEVNQAFDRLLQAYATGNIEEAMRYIAGDEDVTLIEPGEDAISTGQQDVRQSIQADWETTEGENPITVTRRWVSSRGDVAWLSGEHEVAVNYKGQRMTMSGRFTAVATRQDGEWKFHTMHIGAPFPGRPAGEQWPTQPIGTVRPA